MWVRHTEYYTPLPRSDPPAWAPTRGPTLMPASTQYDEAGTSVNYRDPGLSSRAARQSLSSDVFPCGSGRLGLRGMVSDSIVRVGSEVGTKLHQESRITSAGRVARNRASG